MSNQFVDFRRQQAFRMERQILFHLIADYLCQHQHAEP